jgi:hypothetical protein
MKRAHVVLAALTLLGCATAGTSSGGGGQKPQIALDRGGHWSTISFALPNINGPNVELQLKKDELVGFVAGSPLDLHLAGDRVSGTGPNGMVDLTFERDQNTTRVEGMWNGGPVHFTMDPGSLRGIVVWRMGQKFAGQQSCSYDLRGTSAPGVLAGTSACGNMAVGARLEVDPRLPTMMSPNQMTLVLLAALASPP